MSTPTPNADVASGSPSTGSPTHLRHTLAQPLSQVLASKNLDGTPLKALAEAEFISPSDTVIAHRIATVLHEPLDGLPVAVLALMVRGVREGAAALDLSDVPQTLPVTDTDEQSARQRPLSTFVELPPFDELQQTMSRSRLAEHGAIHIDLGNAYLDRYYRDEVAIADALLRREKSHLQVPDHALVEAAVASASLESEQAEAVWSVASRATTVLTGGPGMGKTHTIASIIHALRATLGDQFRVALAAPTGKAAARVTESLRASGDTADAAVTVHRLLGARGRSQQFAYNADNPLPHDLVVIDEASMLSLSLTARLLEALPDSTRLLLVGDPNQLVSVEAGSVLPDLTIGLAGWGNVVELVKERRLGGRRSALARAFRDQGRRLDALGDVDDAARAAALTEARNAVLEPVVGSINPDAAGAATPSDTLAVTCNEAHDADAEPVVNSPSLETANATSDSEIVFINEAEPGIETIPHVLEHAIQLRQAALEGNAAHALEVLGESRLLTAHRSGPLGTARWNRLIETALAKEFPEIGHAAMYVGRPLLITRNDHSLGLANGDTGVIIATPDGPKAAIGDADNPRLFSPWQLSDVETMHAMTVHKAQGSQAAEITVLVPELGSRLLTREMLYTAVTRPQSKLIIVGTEQAIVAALETPVRRASGLRTRLALAPPTQQHKK